MKRLMPVLYAAAASALLVTAPRVLAHFEVYSVTFSGSGAAPPNASPATGTGTVSFDLDALTMRVQANFSGLISTVTASQIHCCTSAPATSTAGAATVVPTFPGFPSGVTSGSYDQTFDLASAGSYDPAFIAANGGNLSGALNALVLGAARGEAYFDIDTTSFGGGEIRGFLTVAQGKVLDVDASASYDALTDGLLILRYLSGLTGTQLTNGALGASATRNDPADIKTYLDNNSEVLDIDGNGTTDLLTDGVLILRYLFGLRGDALIAGAADPLGNRKTAAEIEFYMRSLMP